MLGAVQAGLHYHARDVAIAAAQEAVTAGSTTTGGEAAAQRAAQDVIDTAGDGLLVDTGVEVHRNQGSITATVTGRSLNILPGMPTPTIRQTVAGPIERIP